jgi:two-component sensor histidine kinase
MQDIYKQRSNWKIVLAATGGLVLVVTIWYSNYLANSLMRNEEKIAKIYTSIIEFNLNNSNPDVVVDIFLDVQREFPLPAIIETDGGVSEAWNFTDEDKPIVDENFIKKKKAEFLESGKQPIIGKSSGMKVYYFNSSLVTYIKYYPLVQILLIGSYIALAYFLFSSSRKAEQNRVWAGMAKETAHQLGTPISAILGWLAHLRDTFEGQPEHLEVFDELEKDIDRLNLVADRFSKIGSTPELKVTNLSESIEDVLVYMKRRAPRKVSFNIADSGLQGYKVKINKHLFDWVVENLIRNALDSMDGKGIISTYVYQEENMVCLDVKDTGKGISSSKYKTVFQPGYSTKQRGWGLGLSLAKRIIEEYHNGKIFVKASKMDEGTTFSIKLPKIDS